MSAARFRAAHGFAEDWRHATEICLDALGPAEDANLGFVYLSDRLALHAEAVLARLREATGLAHWAGSVGVGIMSGGAAAVDKGGIAVMLCRLPPESFHVFSGRQPLPGTAHDALHFGVVHADPNTPDMPDLIQDMAGKVSSGFVTGGLTSSRSRSLQIADAVVSGGISGVAFSPAVQVLTRLSQGCRPIGPRHLIGEADGNVIVSLDGRPALDTYREILGPALAQDLRRAVHEVLVGLPVPGSDAGDYLVRNIVAIDPASGLIAINAEVAEGEPLLFCRRDGAAAVADMRRMLAELRAACPQEPRGALYFSCLGRGANTFEDDATEIALIRETFGDLPLAGFFCNGEISHDRLYGYTGVLTLFV